MVDILGDLFSLSIFSKESFRTLCLLIQRTLVGILALLVPFLLPIPLCLPFLLASCILLHLDLECMWTCLLMIRPSLNNFLIFFLELARATSLASLGSIQTLLFPHF